MYTECPFPMISNDLYGYYNLLYFCSDRFDLKPGPTRSPILLLMVKTITFQLDRPCHDLKLLNYYVDDAHDVSIKRF